MAQPSVGFFWKEPFELVYQGWDEMEDVKRPQLTLGSEARRIRFYLLCYVRFMRYREWHGRVEGWNIKAKQFSWRAASKAGVAMLCALQCLSRRRSLEARKQAIDCVL